MSRSARFTLAYPGAVAAATLAFVVSYLMVPILLVHGLNPLRPDRLLVVFLFALFFAGAATGAALVPCLAERFNVRAAWYYALWGAVTGLALGPAAFALYAGSALDASELPALWVNRLAMRLPSDGPFFAFSGAVGGAAYWWIKGRRTAATTSRALL